MSVEENDLNRLRQTILSHQWKEAYEIVALLFAKDVPQFTIFVANQMVRCHLRFRARYDLAWVASFAQEVINFIQDKQAEGKVPESPHEVHETFADAPYGVTSLVGGVVELHGSISKALNAHEKAKHLASAQDRFIVAEISDYWGTVYPLEIQLREMFWDAETTSEGRKILPADIDKGKLYRGIGFLKQPESIGYRSARLLNVVDEIVLRLNK